LEVGQLVEARVVLVLGALYWQAMVVLAVEVRRILHQVVPSLEHSQEEQVYLDKDLRAETDFLLVQLGE
jgi:hypothetical protein